MPKSAFAPLMVIWVGYGLISKIAIAFLVAFFPIVVNTVVGLKEVEPELFGLGARKPRLGDATFSRKFACRTRLPYMFAGIKVAIVLSVTGAIVAEFVAANEGLGYLVSAGQLQFGHGFRPGDSCSFWRCCRSGCFGWRS